MGTMVDEYIGLSDGQLIAMNLADNIISEALKTINERSDYCYFDSFESLKLQTFGSEDILEFVCPRKESLETPKERKSQELFNLTSFANEMCYPSLANFPELCVHSSTMSNSSKQGEGDFQHPTIREATAFYHLEAQAEVEEAVPCGSKDCYKGSPDSSLITETSHNEIITNLHRDIYGMSFDNIQLSDSETENSKQNISRPQDSPYPTLRDAEEFDSSNVGYSEQLYWDNPEGRMRSMEGATMQQSQKFCQLNNNEYFPHCIIPNHYSQLESEVFPYTCIPEVREEDEQELLSESSEELVIIESDGDNLTNNACFPSANPFSNHFLPSIRPSTMLFDSRRTSNPCDGTKESVKVTKEADIEPMKDLSNWEESLEVQMNITEPEPPQVNDAEDSKDEGVFRTRQIWSNVGLMTEHKLNPKLTGLVDDPHGIETMLGVNKVKIKCMDRTPKEKLQISQNSILKVPSPRPSERPKEDDNSCQAAVSVEMKKSKKKKSLISRINNSFANLFKSKKKLAKS